jgi:NAD(P)-dependent dehydrogenase (short-subunit alcohol dehydrogenase family)
LADKGDSVAVWIADILDDQGKKLAAELRHAIFFHCDVTAWSDQLRLFQHAASHSPSGRVDFVVANAGIAPADDVFSYAGDDQEPAEPSLTTVDINLRGALYTTKLALHYFVKQNGSMASSEQQDTCLVLIGSGAAYFDVPRSPTYSATKWAMRGIMVSRLMGTSLPISRTHANFYDLAISMACGARRTILELV